MILIGARKGAAAAVTAKVVAAQTSSEEAVVIQCGFCPYEIFGLKAGELDRIAAHLDRHVAREHRET